MQFTESIVQIALLASSPALVENKVTRKIKNKPSTKVKTVTWLKSSKVSSIIPNNNLL